MACAATFPRLEAAMNPDAIALFRELADRSPSEREDYFAQHQVPAALRAEVESLHRFDVDTANVLSDDEASTGEYVPPASHKPTVIGRYEVVRFLGRGGMGEVYLARDPVLDRNVAIKLMGSELDDAAARRRLVREARAAGGLRHAHIVTIFDAGEHRESTPTNASHVTAIGMYAFLGMFECGKGDVGLAILRSRYESRRLGSSNTSAAVGPEDQGTDCSRTLSLNLVPRISSTSGSARVAVIVS